MSSKELLEDIIYKYPALIGPGLNARERHFEFYGPLIDILLVDRYKKRFAIQVRTSPIENEHASEIITTQNAILSGEAPDLSMLLVSDKIPPQVKKILERNGIGWRELHPFQIRGHLMKNNDIELLQALKGSVLMA